MVFDTSPTLTTPTIAGTLTLNNGYAYADATMAALVIDTAELSIIPRASRLIPPSPSARLPAAGVIFGMQLTNTDVAAHTMTIPSIQE